MKRYRGEEIVTMLDGPVHEETQLEPYGVTLTVDQIHAVKDGGELDFGGGEYRRAEMEELEPEKRSSDDEYGWWELEEGFYHVMFNESMREDAETAMTIEPWRGALEAGISHPCRHVAPSEDCHVLITVPESGVSIKENSRLSIARTLR